MKLPKELEEEIKAAVRKRFEVYPEEVIQGQIEVELAMHERDRWLEYTE